MTDQLPTSKSTRARTPRWLMVLCLLVAVLPPACMAWWWSGLGADRIGWLARLLYWWMPLVCGFAGFCFVWRWRKRETSLVDGLRVGWPGIVLAVAATIVVFWLSPPQMRVQFDETSLVGTSQNMHQQRLAVMTTGAVPYQGQIIPCENMVDKRPTLFAFLVSVVHDLSGYRVANAFVVNAVLLAIALFWLFAAVRARLGLLAGLSAPLLLLSVPLTYVVATSAGFELLASVLLLGTTATAIALVDKPTDGRCAALLGMAVLLAQARYESILAAVILVGLAAILVARRYRPGRYVWLLLAAFPTLVTPLFFLLQHAQDPNFTPEAGGQSLASLLHLAAHTGPFLVALFSPALTQVLPGLVAILGLGWWLRRGFRRNWTRIDLLLGAAPVALTVVVLLWFYGDVQEVTALRLFLPISWLLPLGWLAAFVGGRRQGLHFAGILLFCVLRLVVATSQAAFPQLPIATMTAELDRVVARLPGERATTLWVGVPAQHLIIKGHAALSVRSFEQMAGNIGQLQRQGDLVRIYLIQTSLDRDMAPAFGSSEVLLQRVPSRVVERIGGDMPLTVFELGR